MQIKISLLAILLVLLTAFSSLSYASSTATLASVSAFLGSYNVSSATLSSLTMVNLTLGTSSYVALYSSGSLYLVVNVTSNSYSLLENQTQIANVIFNYTVQQSYNEANISETVAQMHDYQSSSSTVLGECWDITGLSSNLGCSSSTNCASCSFEPTCGGYVPGVGSLAADFGAQAAFGAVANFSSNATILNDSYATFYSAASAINQSNIALELSAMDFAYSNISNASAEMGANPLFSLQLTNAQLNECVDLAGYPDQPSYCTVYGFCGTLSFNQSTLATIGTQLSQISSLPLTRDQVLSIASNASANAQELAYPLELAQKEAQYRLILNTSFKNYSGIVNSSNELLVHMSNQSLSASLTALKSTYANLTINYLSQNLSAQQASIAAQVSSFDAIYNAQKARYAYVVGEANNNTALLLEAQLNSNGNNPKLASYAFEEMYYNNLVFDKVTNYSAVKSGLDAINAYVKDNVNPPFSLASIAIAIYGPFARIITYSLNMPYDSSVAFAPLAGSMLTLIIGLIIIAFVAGYRGSLKKHRRIAVSKRTSRNWALVFLILFAIVLILTYATYASLASAHSTVSMFDSAVGGAGTVAIVTNNTNSYVSLCAQNVTSQLESMGKKVDTYSISDGVCSSSSGASTEDACLNKLASENTPTVMLSPNGTDSISTYSLYGTYLDLRGDNNFMSQCYAARIV